MANLSATQLNSLSAGIATALANLQDRIEARVLAETLPIAGNRLADVAASGQALSATQDLGAALSVRLAELAAQGTQTDAAVIAALEAHLAAEGYAGVVVGISVLGGTVTVTLGATHTEAWAQSLSGDLGFGGLDLSGEATAQVEAAFAYDLTFGTEFGGGFFFDAGGAEEVSLSLTIDDLDLGGAVTLEGKTYEAADMGSQFLGEIAIDLAGIGHISAAAVGTANVSATLAGGADIAIDLAMTQGAYVPALSALFQVDWNFTGAQVNPDNTNANFGNRPVVTFTDVTMDLGGFMERFIAPLITQVQDLLEPLMPVVEILDGNIRMLSDFPGVSGLFDANDDGGVTLIDLVTDIDTAPVQALVDLIRDVENWVALLDGLGFAEGNLNLGDVTISGNSRALDFDLTSAVASLPKFADDLSEVISGLSGGGWTGGGKDILQSLTGSEIFDLPVLTEPSEWMALLLGGDADLVTVDLPKIHLGTGGVAHLPLCPAVPGHQPECGGRYRRAGRSGFRLQLARVDRPRA